jgi:serine/threonine-protein kinase
MADVIYNNRYRLDAKIGEGGMAIVYRGYDLILRRQVAIKVLRPAFSADEAFVQRFDFEAQAAAKLSHPNIVTTHDVGHVDGDHYIVEEYVAGETLATLIARQGTLPESVAVRYARQVCAALAAAHRQALLHRDIKPSNILITREDVVRITDFGIARAIEDGPVGERASDEAVMGSLPYCAPEQLTGEPATESTDLYALGVVMYEMVTGRRPLGGADNDALADAILHTPPPELAASGGAGPAFSAIVAKLLRKDPTTRYRSAGEVLAALRRLARGHADEEEEEGEGESGPDAPTEILRRRTRRAAAQLPSVEIAEPRKPTWRAGRAVAAAAGLVALLVIVALLVAARQAASRGTRMPDLGGRSVAEAVTSLHALGIDDVVIKQQPDPVVQGGLVATTDPAPGASVAQGALVTLVVSDGPATVAVPNVLGQDPAHAQQFLSAQGFQVRVAPKPVHSATVRVGLVAATDPAPGSPLSKGGVVVLATSSGPAMVVVPNIVSMTEDDARKLLARLGLKLAINSEVAVNNIPAQVILSQDPSEKGSLAPGGTVMVDVSAGPAAIEVPQLVGQSLDAARQTLASVGLSVGNIVQAAVPDQPPGTVVSQTPGAFARVSQGAAIDLVVSAGANATAAPAPGQSPAPAGAPPKGAPLTPVPNVIGMSVDQAKGVLERNGYRVDRVTVLPGSPPDAKVLSTDPAVGTMPSSGNAVVLIVGR